MTQEKIIYRLTFTASGRKRVEFLNTRTNEWRIVGIKAAEYVVNSGRGVWLEQAA